MLSYRHSFHAGNHADVLKHAVFVQLLRHLLQKDKPFWCIDTHAGAALHALDEGYATKNAEYESGISRLWALPRDASGRRRDLPPMLAQYVEQVQAVNRGPQLRSYPGSPQIAVQMLRKKDSLRLFELHSTESEQLEKYFRGSEARVEVDAGDGFTGLLSVLPPPPRRALVLVDPSYEDKNDYASVVTALNEGIKRFATGIYMVWYPQVQRRESQQLAGELKRLRQTDWLHVTLTVKDPAADGLGLHGSGLYIVNPPWTLPDMLKQAMPRLVQLLGQDDGALYSLDYEIA
ncbi:MAG: 23S rRNA (adenine(2030)-N(6))-methyltransferase RlmJ [Betaproteobacteria bacterium]|nr:23S rRNA (adenine(2030)-N(6))-methyltransferase RlmJ [Pseudomonadota bacterium]